MVDPQRPDRRWRNPPRRCKSRIRGRARVTRPALGIVAATLGEASTSRDGTPLCSRLSPLEGAKTADVASLQSSNLTGSNAWKWPPSDSESGGQVAFTRTSTSEPHGSISLRPAADNSKGSGRLFSPGCLRPLQSRLTYPPSAARSFALACHVSGPLVGSKAEIHGMAHFAFCRPFGELHFRHQ